MTNHYTQQIQRQFGPTAGAYVSSAVHANGEDLAHIAARAAETRPARALDLGAGGGHVSYAIAPHAGQVIACDLLPDMLDAVSAEATKRGHANIETRAAAAEALPFPDDHFDFLACRFSTHHWRDADAGLREARRVLTNGAPAIFVDVIAPADAAGDVHLQAVELLRDPSHIRDYAVAEWLAKLGRTGFAVQNLTTARLRMDFAAWTQRMRTPAPQIAAIRALQAAASPEIAAHFAIEPDGSFTIDTIMIEVI